MNSSSRTTLCWRPLLLDVSVVFTEGFHCARWIKSITVASSKQGACLRQFHAYSATRVYRRRKEPFLESIIIRSCSSPCLLSIETAPLLLWLKNSTHSAYKDHKTFGHRSFSYAAPSVWNSLPREIRHSQQSTAVFKTALKTHLFRSYLC